MARVKAGRIFETPMAIATDETRVNVVCDRSDNDSLSIYMNDGCIVIEFFKDAHWCGNVYISPDNPQFHLVAERFETRKRNVV